MNPKSKLLLDEALKLPRQQQLELAEHLLERIALDRNDPDAPLIDELDQRWQAFEQGDDPGTDALDAIQEMRKALPALPPK